MAMRSPNALMIAGVIGLRPLRMLLSLGLSRPVFSAQADWLPACSTSQDRAGAGRAVGEYLAHKYQPNRARGRHPSEILIADVLAIYLKDVAPRHAREDETK